MILVRFRLALAALALGCGGPAAAPGKSPTVATDSTEAAAARVKAAEIEKANRAAEAKALGPRSPEPPAKSD